MKKNIKEIETKVPVALPATWNEVSFGNLRLGSTYEHLDVLVTWLIHLIKEEKLINVEKSGKPTSSYYG